MLEQASKTMDGSKKNHHRQTTPNIFATDGSDSDPVTMFKIFVNKRPTQANSPNHPFYLTPIPQKRIKNKEDKWYYQAPMGVNTLGDLVKKACQSAGITGKKKQIILCENQP